MKYGFVLPHGDARTAADFAQAAEQAGWDGFFVWEPVWGIDAWVSLTAAAMCTQRIRLGTLLTPLSRMRPWKLASETATLDQLSNGRVILAVGLGAIESGFESFGEVTDRKTRAELLDEGRVQAELMSLSVRYDLGEISDAEYEEQEEALFEELNAIRAYKEELLEPDAYLDADEP